MRNFKVFAGLLALAGLTVLASGCSAGADSTGDDSSAGALGDTASLTFGADGSVKLTGDLVEGGSVRVSYDAARLPDCRGDFEGKPGWTITGFASVAGADAETFATDHPAVVKLPTHGDLSLWFQVTNRWGCSAYDSKYGANYHFDIGGHGATTTPSIVFEADGGITQVGDLVSGGKVAVHYTQDRLSKCRGTSNGYAQWNITGYASMNGAKAVPFSTTVPADNANRTDVDALVDLPEAGDLALWFENTSRWGCDAFDSKSGANYHFRVR